MTTIYSIVIQPEDQEYGERGEDYLRIPVQRANLIEGHGIEGDRKAGHHPNRQLNLLSLEWLEGLEPQGYRTGPGQFGEQIVLAGLAVERLEPGTRLRLGDQARVEVTKSRTGCERLQAAQKGKAIDGLGPIGVMAKVVEGGTIRVGDTVTVLESSPSKAAV